MDPRLQELLTKFQELLNNLEQNKEEYINEHGQGSYNQLVNFLNDRIRYIKSDTPKVRRNINKLEGQYQQKLREFDDTPSSISGSFPTTPSTTTSPTSASATTENKSAGISPAAAGFSSALQILTQTLLQSNDNIIKSIGTATSGISEAMVAFNKRKEDVMQNTISIDKISNKLVRRQAELEDFEKTPSGEEVLKVETLKREIATGDLSDEQKSAKEAEIETLIKSDGFKEAERKQSKLQEDISMLDERRRELEKRKIEIENRGLLILSKSLQTAAKALGEFASEIRRVQQQFGTSAAQAVTLSFRDIGQSILSALPGTGPMVSRAQIQSARASFQDEFGGLVSPEATRRIAQRSVAEGITDQQQAQARRVFMTQTGGNLGGAQIAEARFINQFKDAGLTAKDAMQAIGKNAELLARNGTRFADSFARAAIDAKKIGVDLSKIDQVGDNIIGNFEGFLESQAELGAMGFGFDTSRLAELAETGDTGALSEELRSQLGAQGKDLGSLRRSERLAIESAFGINISELQRMAEPGAKGSGETMEDIQKETNSFLSQLINSFAPVAGLLSFVGTVLSGVHSVLLTQIAVNTGGFGLLMTKLLSPQMGPALPPGVGAAARAPMSMLGKVGMGVTGATIGIGGAMTGREMVKGGDTGLGIGLGALAGGLGLALALAPFTGGMSLLALGGGALLGGGVAASGLLADDMVSKSGYGERVLYHENGPPVALNNQDTIVAYADDMVSTEANITTLSKGALAPAMDAAKSNVTMDTKTMEGKLDQVIAVVAQIAPAIAGMNIHLDGSRVGKVLAENEGMAVMSGGLRAQRG